MSDSATRGLKIPSTATSGHGAAMDGDCAAIPTPGFHPHDNRNKAFSGFTLAAPRRARFHGPSDQLSIGGNGMKTKTLLLVGAAAVWCVAVSAALAEGPKAHGDEAEAACIQAAKKLKGEERDKAVAACEKRGDSPARHTQQEKMKTCNVEAGRRSLHGDERRAFMSSCLKG
jgi:hypothetical protein